MQISVNTPKCFPEDPAMAAANLEPIFELKEFAFLGQWVVTSLEKALEQISQETSSFPDPEDRQEMVIETAQINRPLFSQLLQKLSWAEAAPAIAHFETRLDWQQNLKTGIWKCTVRIEDANDRCIRKMTSRRKAEWLAETDWNEPARKQAERLLLSRALNDCPSICRLLYGQWQHALENGSSFLPQKIEKPFRPETLGHTIASICPSGCDLLMMAEDPIQPE